MSSVAGGRSLQSQPVVPVAHRAAATPLATSAEENLRPLGERVLVGAKKGAIVAVPLGLATGAGYGAFAALAAGSAGLVPYGVGVGLATVGVPMAVAGVAAGSTAAAAGKGGRQTRAMAAGAAGAAVGAMTAVAAAALLDVGAKQGKPGFLLAGAISGVLAGWAAAHYANR